jgi:hypothetical protein
MEDPENRCIVFGGYSPISPAGIHKIKSLSTIFIRIIFMTFVLPPPNIELFDGEAIPGTKPLLAGRIETLWHCSVSFPDPATKGTNMLPGNCSQHIAVFIETETFAYFF